MVTFKLRRQKDRRRKQKHGLVKIRTKDRNSGSTKSPNLIGRKAVCRNLVVCSIWI